MDAEPVAPTSTRVARNGHVHWSAAAREKPPELSCASVAENGPFPARQHRGHPPPLTAEPGMPDRVYPPEDPVEPSGLDRFPDAVLANPGSPQLPDLSDAVLSRCDFRDHPVGAGDLFVHQTKKAPTGPVSPPA
jgi:hypothetical protein